MYTMKDVCRETGMTYENLKWQKFRKVLTILIRSKSFMMMFWPEGLNTAATCCH